MAPEIPILIIAYNRPTETTLVIDQIANIAPKSNIYLWQDGPQTGNSNDINYNITREILKLFSKKRPNTHVRLNQANMGCRLSVRSAINWFFENEKFGIICEDDIIISLAFYDFVKRYKLWCENNGSVGVIGGHSLTLHNKPFLNMHGTVWGWASWSHVWGLYSEKFDSESIKHKIDTYYHKREKFHEYQVLNSFYHSQNVTHTWDYHWLKTRIENEILTLMPNRPLTLNIGFNGSGTHYINQKTPHFIKKAAILFKKYSFDPATCSQNDEFIEPLTDPVSIESQNYFKAKFSKLTKLKNYIFHSF